MKPIFLVAGGDARLAVNQEGWLAQVALEQKLVAAVERLGRPVQRAHPFVLAKGHGFVDSQKAGLEVFRGIPADAPVVVATAVEPCSHHLWPGLSTHEGPILTVTRWTGAWPGAAGTLNLNGDLLKRGIKHGTLWSESFEDDGFMDGLKRWLERGKLKHDAGPVRPFDLKPKEAPADLGDAMRTGRDFARRWRQEKALLGVFDEGSSGLGDLVVPDALLGAAGVFKERLSLAALSTLR